MSCRTHPSIRSTSSTVGSGGGGGSSGGISLLPQFSPPPGVHNFALENRPPQLPSRNSPMRLLGLVVTGVFCMAGVCAVGSAAVEPLRVNGGYLGSGMSSMVSSAINSANKAAERHAQEHYAARTEYLERRGLRRLEEPLPAATATLGARLPENEGAPEPEPEPEPKPKPPQAQALLLRMAALRASTNAIDDAAVQQYFPAWTAAAPGAPWTHEAVLRDLVLAVSQLAHRSSVGGAPLSVRRQSGPP